MDIITWNMEYSHSSKIKQKQKQNKTKQQNHTLDQEGPSESSCFTSECPPSETHLSRDLLSARSWRI